MTTNATLFRIHAPFPEWLTRGSANAIEAQIFDASGTLIAPDSGTVTVYDGANVKVVDAAAVVVAADIATYTIAAVDLPDSGGASCGLPFHYRRHDAPYTFVGAARQMCITEDRAGITQYQVGGVTKRISVSSHKPGGTAADALGFFN